MTFCNGERVNILILPISIKKFLFLRTSAIGSIIIIIIIKNVRLYDLMKGANRTLTSLFSNIPSQRLHKISIFYWFIAFLYFIMLKLIKSSFDWVIFNLNAISSVTFSLMLSSYEQKAETLFFVLFTRLILTAVYATKTNLLTVYRYFHLIFSLSGIFILQVN